MVLVPVLKVVAGQQQLQQGQFHKQLIKNLTMSLDLLLQALCSGVLLVIELRIEYYS